MIIKYQISVIVNTYMKTAGFKTKSRELLVLSAMKII